MTKKINRPHVPRKPGRYGLGVRKRTDGRARPYYPRLTVAGGYVYGGSHETAEAAALEFEELRERYPRLHAPTHPKKHVSDLFSSMVSVRIRG